MASLKKIKKKTGGAGLSYSHQFLSAKTIEVHIHARESRLSLPGLAAPLRCGF